MKKVFISLPMKGLSDEEIHKNFDDAADCVKLIYGEDIDILNSWVDDDPPEGVNIPVYYLSKSIEVLSHADIAYFHYGWDEASGCRIEYRVANCYGIETYATGVPEIKADDIPEDDFEDYVSTGFIKAMEGTDADGEEGYIVKHEDHTSWCPKEEFDKFNRKIDEMPFGMALDLCRQGHPISRKGWSGKGLFVVYQKGYPKGISCNKQTAEAWGLNEGDLFKCDPYLQINTVDGSHAMWVPSIRDCLADDWMICKKGKGDENNG